ncbi:hypothetical protein L1D54_23600 [Vibrio brasiliensis]|uniref:hypothetical protein n=1 Tax=Vibrio brasiliensis TaxID=170652 RepID=UPI001EFC9C67|nr:hypothetical protein [Vibrio brasiliensis]MCG9753427.1 hypothetical protein [Vibrio brasiliensis]
MSKSKPLTPQERKLERQTIGVAFLQELIDQTRLAVKVSPLNEQDIRCQIYDERRVLLWLEYSSSWGCLRDRAFHIDLQRVSDEQDDVLMGFYDGRIGRLHIILIEPLNEESAQQLPDRLLALVTYAAIYFLTTYPDSVGVYLLDPPTGFITHHESYGFSIIKHNETLMMFATFESLFERQKDILFDILLTEKPLELGLELDEQDLGGAHNA